jgi:NTE family protein
MLRALYERGIHADLLIATSVGSLNAAFVASRPQTVATIDELARIWRGLRREDVFPISVRTLLHALSGRRDHLIEDCALRRLVQRHIQLRSLEDAVIPLHLVAFDMISGHEVLLSRGPALDAVVAATAIPGVLPPVLWGEQRLVDGGVVNNTPISHAVELGAERVYVLSTQHESRALGRPARTALEAASHSVGLLTAARFEAELARYADAVEVIVLPALNSGRVQTSDFDHTSRLIIEGLAAARDALAATEAARKTLAA